MIVLDIATLPPPLTYKYKEVDTEEFVRFIKYYFNMGDTSEFENWLDIKK